MLTLNINNKDFISINDSGETIVKEDSLKILKDEIEDEEIIKRILLEK